MTAILPEPATAVVFESSTALESVIGAPLLMVPGLNAWLGKSDYQQSIDSGLTETFEAYCDRISRKEAK